jgi:hypothetical protein
MLIHALNSFLAWRHLLSCGYLAEARLFARSIHEALSQALAFAVDDALAQKFYEGVTIQPRTVRDRLAQAFVDENKPKRGICNQFLGHYKPLSRRAHPTLNSFTMRTAPDGCGA